MKAVLLLIAAVVLLLRLQQYVGPQVYKSRPYHPISIAELAAADPSHWPAVLHTHIEVAGWLTYAKLEDDGDFHLRLCDAADVQGMNRTRCVVAELIPTMASTAHASNHLVVGQKLRVRGIYRYDAERGHRFAEIHPCEMLEIIQ